MLPSAVGHGVLTATSIVANASSYKCEDRVIGPVTLNDQIEKAYASVRSNQSRRLMRQEILASRVFSIVLWREGVPINIQFDVSINYLKEILSLEARVTNQFLTCYPTTEEPQFNGILD
ncbi:Bgt_avrF2_23 [Blumeria graminis f. sp. tritici]|uniref:Bgt_avrF2_23 n=2 Tax=Blumeria graminis TaxID=34373 RepID=A0A9X9MGX6_BLUGR|nr:Bgt_avrF2_23 [Blumeria graminis f. sp. tritici]